MKRKIDISRVRLRVDTSKNPLLKEVLEKINENEEIKTLWKVINVMAIDRLGMSDHGPNHFQIVAQNGLKISRILNKRNIKMSAVSDFGLSYELSEVIIFLGCVLHDLGMSIHRKGHEEYSLFLAKDFLTDILSFLPTVDRVIVTSEVLHAIISHRSDGMPQTLEAGIVRMADALDMGKGRSRITYDRGEINIYSESDIAISKIEITEGKEKPIEVKIFMINPAGVFQIDDIMTEKLKGSNLEKFMYIVAYINDQKGERLYKKFSL